MQQKLHQAKVGKKGNASKWVTVGAVVVVIGVAAYFAYGPITAWWAKRSEAAQQASAPPPVTNAPPVEEPPAPKELPVLPAVWTLDVDQAKIPEGKANGTIAGTNFMVETAICVPQLLRLSQGAAASPDRELQIFLHLSASDGVAGRSWTIKREDPASRDVPQIVERWKTDPRYAAQSKSFTTGYAMKLELGNVKSNQITGKIFLALPDPEQSVVAGLFTAATGTANPNAAFAKNPAMMPPRGALQIPPGGIDRSAYERYLGRKR